MKFSLPWFFKKKGSQEAFQEKLENYRKAAATNPQDLRIQTKIAELYLSHGDKNGAVKAYRAAASAYQQAGKDTIVISIYRHILSVDPGQIEVYHQLCDACLKKYLVGDAVEVMVRLATHYYEHDMKYEAAQALKRIHALDPENRFYTSKVEKFYKEKNLSPEEVQKIGPKGKWDLVEQKAEKKHGDEEAPAGGFFDLEQVLDESSINMVPGVGQENGETSNPSLDTLTPDKVLEELKNLVSADAQQDSPEFHYNLGLAYMRRREHASAMGEFQKAADGITNRIDCYYMLIECSMAIQDFDAAKKNIAQALTLDSLTAKDKLTLQYSLGLVYKGKGDRKEALKIFKKIYDRDKNFKSVAMEINELS